MTIECFQVRYIPPRESEAYVMTSTWYDTREDAEVHARCCLTYLPRWRFEVIRVTREI